MPDKQTALRGWIWFFWIAAVFNFVIGAAGMFAPDQNIDTRTIGLLVFAFGIVYAFVARNPDRYANVLWAGVFGKVGVVALLIASGVGREGGPMSAVLAVDLLFAFGFLLHLLTRVEGAEAQE